MTLAVYSDGHMLWLCMSVEQRYIELQVHAHACLHMGRLHTTDGQTPAQRLKCVLTSY